MKRGTHIKHIIEFWSLFAINGVMLWFFRGYFYLVIAVAMLLLFFYAIISVYVVRRYVTVSMEMPATTMPKNTEFLVKIKVRNRCPLSLVSGRIFLQVGNRFMGEPQRLVVTVPIKALGEEVVSLPIRPEYVGNVEVSGERFVMEDIMAFHGVTLPLSLQEQIYILPAGRTEEVFDLNAYQVGMSEVEESKLKGNDFSDVSEVREYIPGDAMKNIHWKLSAKKADLMVKERLRMSTGKLLVVLVMDSEQPRQMDETVERVYGLGRQLIRSQIPVTLYWWNRRFKEICQATAESEHEWQEVMIQLFSSPVGDGYVEQQFRRLQPGSGYLLVNGEGVFVVEG